LFQSEYRAEPFYSKIMEAVDAGKVPNKVGREQLMKTLTGYGVKQEELADMAADFDEMFAAAPGGKVSKDDIFALAADKAWGQNTVKVLDQDLNKALEEIQTRINANRVLGQQLEQQYAAARTTGDQETADKLLQQLDEWQVQHEGLYAEFDDLNDGHLTGGTTKFSEYQVPGGVPGTYKEILLRNPMAKGFADPHFGNVGDVMAHIRADDIELPDGSKAFRIQEIQSDLHQRGRDEGYYGRELQDELSSLEKQYEDVLNRDRNDYNGLYPTKSWDIGRSSPDRDLAEKLEFDIQQLRNRVEGKAPDAPFKKSWPELAAKTAIRQAVEQGHTKMTLVKGADIAEAVGGPPEALGAFYDEKMTNILSKIVKKGGGTVEKITAKELPADLLMSGSVMNQRGDLLKDGIFLSPHYKDVEVRVQYSPITSYGGGEPQLRDSWVAFIKQDDSPISHRTMFNSPEEAAQWAEEYIPKHFGKGKSMTVFNLSDSLRNEVMQKGQTLYQKNRGSITFEGNRATINPMRPDASTAPHEVSHAMRRLLPEDLASEASGMYSGGSWDVPAEEAFATGLEGLLQQGLNTTSPTMQPTSQYFQNQMSQIYQNPMVTPSGSDQLMRKILGITDTTSPLDMQNVPNPFRPLAAGAAYNALARQNQYGGIM
jgi:hypothetical protein